MPTPIIRRAFAWMLALALLLGCTLLPAHATGEAPRLRDNLYKEGLGLRVAMTGQLENPGEAFVITGPEGTVPIREVTLDGNNIYLIVTETPLDLTASYTIVYNGDSFPVKMPIYYSTAEFESLYTYQGDDLGAVWTPERTLFRLWAPTASKVLVNLYESGTEGTADLLEQIEMTPDVNGTWIAEAAGDRNGVYYTYSVTVDGVTREACDPYARTTGVNGKRAMILDLDSTDPEGWENDRDPHYDEPLTDAVIYELHVRDLSSDPSSGISHTGKFLGLIEIGTTNAAGIPTGLDHIKNLGITHIHLLPSYDYASVDETDPDACFNWGYDPVNYNVPEGSYSTDPYHGEVRVKEFKQMVQGLHNNGISVIMDVVYNHVYDAESFCFNNIVPGYFTRISNTGVYSNGSACGNDTASERAMVKKYIVDSVVYWAEEYHIDGFRFDLAGLIDTETIRECMEEVHKTHPNVIFYGEGWTMNTAVTKDGYDMAHQGNVSKLPGFAFFSDGIRDALRGPNSKASEPGYVAGIGGYGSTVQGWFLASSSWCKNPTQTINYASCHDGYSLWDRIVMSTYESSHEERIKMNNLAAAIIMTSQGTPLFQAGEEMLRSKPLEEGGYSHNSYNLPDSVNSIKWDNLNDPAYQDVVSYYAGLIAFRRAHPALRMTTAEDVAQYISLLEDLEFGVNGFWFAPGAGGEDNALVVIFNPRSSATTVPLPEGQWEIHINAQDAGTVALGTVEGSVEVEPTSAMVLVQAVQEPEETVPAGADGNLDEELRIFDSMILVLTLILSVSTLIGTVILLRRRKKA